MSLFQQAKKSQAKLRLGLVGPAGSGKTMTALRIANGIAGGKKIAVIDTEHGSASLYAGASIDFDVCNLESFEVEKYIDALKAAEEAGYHVVIVDSLSHAWSGKGGILEFVDSAGKRNAGGNFSAWRDATPRHNRLVEAILASKCHIIVTLRSKTEYVVENVGGRTTVRKVGLQPIQREGMEYEFTVCGDVSADHDLMITKTRATFLKDAVIREAGEELGKQLAKWLEDGEAVAPPAPTPFKTTITTSIEDTLASITKASVASLERLLPKVLARAAAGELTEDQKVRIMAAMQVRMTELEANQEVVAT